VTATIAATDDAIRHHASMSDGWDIQDGYHDIDGLWHPTTPSARAALQRHFGRTDQRDIPPQTPTWWTVRAGESHRLWNLADIELEDGTVLHGVGQLPVDLPLGYHWLRPVDGWTPSRLVVTPAKCRQPDRSWGWSVQLYGLQSARSYGHGTLGDLAELGRWARTTGASLVQVSPVSAVSMTPRIEPSPYFPSSRRFRSPLYLDISALPGIETMVGSLRRPAMAERIDREAVSTMLLPVLAKLSALGAHDPSFVAWRTAHPSVEQYGIYEVIARRHGPNWKIWPAQFLDPASPAVAEIARASPDEMTMHVWAQWQLEVQLRHAGAQCPLMGDLPVGCSDQGFDAWAWQDVLALGASIGAPPDLLAPQGQDWGLPPFTPWKLRAAGYQPFIDIVRSSLVGLAGLRIDHVLGLFRLWCTARDIGEGAYVQQDTEALLGIIRLEAARANAFCVGEDLGTVAPSVRDELRASNVLGCSVAWFEAGEPSTWRSETLASLGTHDLATTPGLLTGADLDARRAHDLPVNEHAYAGLQARAIAVSGKPLGTPWEDSLVALHHEAASSPAVLFTASVEDASGLMTPMNVPGTVNEWPNWRQPGAVLESLAASPLAARIADAVNSGRNSLP
jgi:4-alpha-glucanotransferase